MNTLTPVQNVYNYSSSPFSPLAVNDPTDFENVLQSTAGVDAVASNDPWQPANAQNQSPQAFNGPVTPASGNPQQGLLPLVLQDLMTSAGTLSVPDWVAQAQRVISNVLPQAVVNLYHQAQQTLLTGANFSGLF